MGDIDNNIIVIQNPEDLFHTGEASIESMEVNDKAVMEEREISPDALQEMEKFIKEQGGTNNE